MKLIIIFGIFIFTNLCQATNNQEVSEDKYPRHKVYFDLRLDTFNTDTKYDNSSSVGDSTSGFKFWGARFNFIGEIDNKTSYRVRLDMTKEFTTASSSEDQIPETFNYVYFDHKLSDHFTLRLGKQFVVISSWEFNYDISKQYYYSQTYLEVGNFYETGVALMYKVDGHTLGLQAVNDLDESSDLSRSTWGFYWYGNLMDGKLLPIVNMHLLPTGSYNYTGSPDLSAKQRLTWTLGAKYHITSNMEIDFIFGGYDVPNHTAYDSAGTITAQLKKKWSNVIAGFRYKFEDPKIHAVLKLSQDTSKIGGEDDADILRGSLSAEWFPSTSDRIWYHATILFAEETYDQTPAKDREVYTALIGFGVDYR